MLLAEVWAVVRAHDGITPGRNVMLYREDAANVEIGVEVAEEFEAIGRVVCRRLPEGRVARTTHRGRYEGLGRGHAAVVEWCDRRGVERAGPRWEIYGHHTEVVTEQTVEIAHLLR